MAYMTSSRLRAPRGSKWLTQNADVSVWFWPELEDAQENPPK